MAASGEGAVMTTFLAPPFKWSLALAMSRKTPVDSTTYSAPSAPQGISAGLLLGGCEEPKKRENYKYFLGIYDLPHVHADGVAIDNELAILGLDVTLELSVGGVILEHVDLNRILVLDKLHESGMVVSIAQEFLTM
jgi:hypothetical protein